MERYLVLYEGNNAGDCFFHRGCQECDNDSSCFTTDDEGFRVSKFEEFDDKCQRAYLSRLRKHNKCYHDGHDLDWQFECHARIYGWKRVDKEWTQINGRETNVRRFNQAVVVIAKKNKKSPTLSANAIFMAFGEGEPGAKSYLFAKDGLQAKQIAGAHCVKMVEKSPTLSTECDIHGTTLKITMGDNLIIPLSSGDERHQQSKEGLNASYLGVDEIHVVDRKAMKRVERAGISREQPIQGEFTTAGTDPDGYGFERVEFCRKVISGEAEDQRLFAAIYEAPQDLTDEDLEKDPLKYCKMANPAWAHTIRETEIIADYHSSKQKGVLAMADFKMYRLNIWQTSSNPMIQATDWEACRSTFEISEFYGSPCGLGLDLAKVNDVAAAVFTFGRDDLKFQYPFLWMTRRYAEENRHLVTGFIEWEHTGDLILIDGSRIHDQDILDTLEPHIERCKPAMLVYDETFAGDIAIKIQDECGGERSCDLFAMAQTHAKYTEPTTEWLNDLTEHQLRHPGNACLDWMTRNVFLDLRGKLCKPTRENDKTERHKKIDGIQASIMSHLAFRRKPERTSVYNEPGRGVLTI